MMNKIARISLTFILIISVIASATLNISASTTKYTCTKTTKRKSVSVSGTKLPGDFHYQLIKVKGSSSVKKKINKTLNKDYNNFVSEYWSAFKEYLVNSYLYGEDTDGYICSKDAKVKYQSNKYYSIRFEENWFVGGVHNRTRSGKVFSKKSGKGLKLSTFVKGNDSTIKNKIIKAFLKKINGTESEYSTQVQIIKNKSISSYKFYITKKKVYIFFECYELEMGNGDYCVSLNR